MVTQDNSFQAMIAGLEQAGITRLELARRVGVSRVQIWRLQTGMSQQPSYRVGAKIKKLHEALTKHG